LQENPEAWRETAVEVALEATLRDPVEALRGAVRARGTLAGRLAAPEATLAVEGSDLLVDGRAVRSARLEGSLSGSLLRVDALSVDAEPGTLSLSGLADLEAQSLSDARFAFDIEDLAAMARLVPGAPALAGSARGEGTLVRDASGEVALAARGLSVEGTALGDVALRAKVDGRRIELQQLQLEGPLGEAEAQGTITIGEGRGEGTLFPFRAAHDGIDLACTAPLAFAWGEQGVSLRGLRAQVLGGTVEGDLLYGERVGAHLVARGISFPSEFDGALDLAIDAEGPADGPVATVRLSSDRLAYRGVACGVALTARQGENGLVIERFDVANGERRAAGSAHLPYVAGRAGLRRVDGGVQRLKLRVDAPDLGEAAQFGLSGRDLSVLVDAEGPSVQAHVRLLDLAYAPENLEIRGETRIEIASGTPGTKVTLASGEGAPLFLRGGLESAAALDWSSPGDAWERLLGGALTGSVTANLPDLKVLQPLLPMFVRLEGAAAVEVALGGSAGAPSWTGLVRLDCPALRLAGDLPSIQDLAARIALSGREARIESFEGLLGYERFRIEGGARLPPGGSPELDLRVMGQNLLLARTPTLRLRADVDVALKGALDALAAKGSVAVSDALYSRPLSLLSEGRAAADDKLQLFAIREGPFARLSLDIDVTAPETIRIENNVAQGLLSANLHLGGSGAVPIPEGRIDFRDLTVRIPVSGTKLKVERGQLSFPVEDPFAPRLMAGARTRMQGYDLSVAVAGRLPDLDVFVASVPPLATEDALVLLTTGTLPKDLERKGGSAAISMAGSYLGERLLERLSGPSDPDKESFFDRFSAEVGRDVSVTGQPTVGAEFRITERWYLAGGRDKYDDYNAGILLRLRFR